MAALNDLKTMHARQGMIDWKLLGPFFWGWYHDHANDIIVKRKVVFFSVSIRVRDLHPLFVQLFGPEPASTALVDDTP